MFNFTTQRVVNTFTQGKEYAIFTNDPNKDRVRIFDTIFDKANILDIQFKKYTPESLATVTFDFSKINKPGIWRISLYIGLSQSSADSFYANDYVYKGKPFYIEFKVNGSGDTVSDTPAEIAARAVSNAKKYLALTSDRELLTIAANQGNVTITATDGYQIIRVANLQYFDPEANKIDCCSFEGEYVDVITGVPACYNINEDGEVTSLGTTFKDDECKQPGANETLIIPGMEEFGGYEWIMRNLRLPTYANTNYWSPNKNEMPAVGGKYNQVVIRLIKDRDGIGGEVVGQRATSVTNHVYYINDSLQTAFDSVIAALIPAKTDADDDLENPYDTQTYEIPKEADPKKINQTEPKKKAGETNP